MIWRSAGEAEGFQGLLCFRRVYVHAQRLAEAAHGEGYGERGGWFGVDVYDAGGDGAAGNFLDQGGGAA